MGSPMLMAEELEERQNLFSAPRERFQGYGVMGVPFVSGHLLAFRRMTSNSLGPVYSSIWHRDPAGSWTMVVDADPELSCPRYFGAAMDRILVRDIDLCWDGPRRLSIQVPELRLQWGLRFSSDGFTRVMSWVGSILPESVWNTAGLRGALGKMGGKALGVGQIALSGEVPNGQRFFSTPRVVFRVEATAAMVEGEDLGPMGPLPDQVRLGDFWLPNGGLFAIGEAGFERHDLMGPAPKGKGGG